MSGDPKGSVEVKGHCEERFEPVREALASRLGSGEELGASLVVNVGGENVIDVWGGWRDLGRTLPWAEDTIANIWSGTKTITSLAVLMLVDRGQLDPFAPVAEYWPEFAANGKQAVEVRHLLSHTSGVAGWEPPFTLEDFYDWDLATERLAAQAPWWEPGTVSGYHAANFGHLLGELVRRVTGEGLGTFIAEEIAAPLGADFQLGAAERDWDRIAELDPPPAMDISALPQDSPAYKVLTAPAIAATDASSPEWRRAELGGSNGHANARSVGRILSALALGGAVDGVKLLSPSTIELIFQEQSHDTDLILFAPYRFGIGYALSEDETVPYVPGGRTCYWGGWGGSMMVTDIDRGITIAYVMNRMAAGAVGSDRAEAYFRALETCLD